MADGLSMGAVSTEGAPALEVRGLTRRFGSRVALQGVDLCVRQGDVYGFLGPNGAGKTTALRCILGLIRADAGDIAIFGERDPVRRRRGVGALVETPRFHRWLSGRANLEIACSYAGISPRKEVDRVLGLVGLADRGDDRVVGYSLGMKQRLGLAQALLGSPRILLLDEPTNGLDPQGMRDVRELLRSLAEVEKLTVLISSHLLFEVESIATRVGILREGRRVAEGDLGALRGDAPRVEVGGADLEAIQAVIAGLDGAAIVGGDGGRVEVELTGLDVAALNRTLVERGCAIDCLIPGGRSLEDVFLGLTGDA